LDATIHNRDLETSLAPESPIERQLGMIKAAFGRQ